MRLWLVGFIALASVPADAQDVATDTELFAGYCFAASSLSSFIGKIGALQDCDPGNPSCLETRELGAVLQREQDAIHKRASDYLNARRLFHERSKTPAWQGVERAMKAAGDDFKACTGNGTGRDIKAEACERMKRCQDLSRLPF
jgi:hypothetical protein